MANFPTLSVVPNYPLDPDGEIEDAVSRSEFGAGYQQTRPKFTRARRSFGLTYTLRTADVATLKAFEITTLRNGADSFTWPHPLTGTTYTVRLKAPIKYSLAEYDQTTVSMTLQEV